MGRGDHWELAARHVAADRLHRDVPVPEDHARQRLDLDIGHRGALRLGEAPDLGLGKADVLHLSRRDLGHQGFDLGLREAEGGRRVAVELLRQRPHGGVAALLDIRERGFDHGVDLGAVFCPVGCGLALFQTRDHGSVLIFRFDCASAAAHCRRRNHGDDPDRPRAPHSFPIDVTEKPSTVNVVNCRGRFPAA